MPEGAGCPACGYSLRGLRGLICPECGRAIDPAELGPRPVRWTRASRAALAGVLLALVCAALMLAVAAVSPGRSGVSVERLGFSAALLTASGAALGAWGRWRWRVLSWSGPAQARLASAVWLALAAVTILAIWFEAV